MAPKVSGAVQAKETIYKVKGACQNMSKPGAQAQSHRSQRIERLNPNVSQ